MIPGKGGRPVDESLPSYVAMCPKCGSEQEFRQHRVGFEKNGITPKYRYRCRTCHARKQAERRGQKSAE